MKKKTKKGRPPTGGRTYISRSVSFDPELKEAADTRARELGFKSFSEYVSRLVERDIIHGGPMLIESRRGGS